MNPSKKFLHYIISFFTVFVFIAMAFLPLQTYAVDISLFTPSNLISDERFSDTETLGGVEGIQRFLEQKGSLLADTSPEFLLKLREPDSSLKSRLPDPRPDLGRLRTAAELIYDASTSAGLNPQVVLVTLQKEQSLITADFNGDRLQRALDRSLGFGCPDGGVCGDIYLGFYHQLFGNFDNEGNRYIGMPASLMRSFNYEVGGTRVGRGPMVDAAGNAFGSGTRVRVSRVGDVITLENTQGPPNNAPATQTVTLSNFATAALYRYTPHVYNGNFNFWRFFNDWFRYPDGTLITRSGEGSIYVVHSGLLRPISTFVMQQRGLDPVSVITISSSEFNEFEQGAPMTPTDGTLIKNSNDTVYLMQGGQKKLLSTFVAAQRGLDPAQAVALPDSEVELYEDGGVALPEEGTLVKSSDSPAVFIITNNQKRLLTGFVFQQRKYSFANVLTAAPGELDQYPTGPVMTPQDGTLIKSVESPAVYQVVNGVLRPIKYFVFVGKGFSFRDVVSVPAEELANWQIGNLLPPETGTLIKAEDDPTVYYMEAGVLRPVSFGVFQVRKFDFTDVFEIETSELEGFETGDMLPLPEYGLIKTESDPTVYYVVDGILRPLTLTAFNNRRLLFENVVTIPDAELANYEIGALVVN